MLYPFQSTKKHYSFLKELCLCFLCSFCLLDACAFFRDVAQKSKEISGGIRPIRKAGQFDVLLTEPMSSRIAPTEFGQLYESGWLNVNVPVHYAQTEPQLCTRCPRTQSWGSNGLSLLTVPKQYKSNLILCSSHFEESDFVNFGEFSRGFVKRLLLKPGAVHDQSTTSGQPVSKTLLSTHGSAMLCGFHVIWRS